ncbi:hypothetical protein DPMN_046786 [Dreissena polymorpha]|uniref:Mab-21-like HhH/H2TH-like domain-containing protein n=1 Tax=Dreissena polymorpha TaxID=45954 RepID=A0A9D4D958_DREPO|nr:hypothetical protein DPMN_046786 [Dreissena polymorpha]
MAEGGVRHYTEWTPRLINRSRYEYEDESKETNTIMNLLGYGPVIRQKRIEAWKEFDRLQNAHNNKNNTGWWITAGSKSEGLTCFLESDRDSLHVLPFTVCVEDGFDTRTLPFYINVFKMDMQSCNAGYCRLLVERICPSLPWVIIHSATNDEHGSILMNSTYFVEYYREHYRWSDSTVKHARAGPSVPYSDGPVRHDLVGAFHCNCLIILQKWASRARHWPPPEIVEKVIAMGAFVTPIGFKWSEYNDIEWRICFNTAETELVNNLNDTQVKIYVIMKMIVNDVLKPQAKEVTSYILKNIVLWLAENNPQTLFHSGSLLHWLHEGLDVLRTAISVRQLPYYMIPERNLMAEREFDVDQQRELVRSITDMINEGPRMLLRLNKIRQAIICHPEPLLWYSKMRTELEMLLLEKNNIEIRCSDEDLMIDQSSEFKKLFKTYIRMAQIGLLVWMRMLLEGSSVDDPSVVVNSILS